MNLNRSEIMKNAWTLYRTIFGGAKGRNIFRAALRLAWREAKRAASLAALDAKRTVAQKTAHAALTALEAKERWTATDYAQAETLRRAAYA